MKELNPIIERQGEKIELSEVKPVEKKEVYQGSMWVHPGQKCWEYDFITNEVKEAEYESVTVEFGETVVDRKILIKKNCGYAVALNAKNAMRKLSKMHGVNLRWK